MAQTSRAWVLDVGAGQHAAAGAPHVVEYLLATETVPVPRTPRHCRGLLVWRGRMIPVIDLAPLIAEGATAATATRRAVVLAWQERPREPLQYGALLVTAAPGETWVSDDMAGDLAAAPKAFGHFARSGFMDNEELIPILDVRRLFGRPLPAALIGSGTARGNVYPLGEVVNAAKPFSPQHAAAGMATWQTLTSAIDLLALPPAQAAPAADTAQAGISHAAPGAVVIPFSAGKLELRQNIALGIMPATHGEVPAPGAAVADTSILTVDGGAAETEPVAIAGSAFATPRDDDSPATLPRHTGTIESFERLHALEKRSCPLAHDRTFRHRVRAIVLMLGLLSAAYLALAYHFSSGVAATGSAPRDAAPGGIDPHSIPATPAQPPK